MAADPNPNPETAEVNLFDPAVSACPQPVYRPPDGSRHSLCWRGQRRNLAHHERDRYEPELGTVD